MKKPSKLFKFYANLVAGFIPFHDKRSTVRRNIIYKKPYKLIKEQWCQTSESRDGGGRKIHQFLPDSENTTMFLQLAQIVM